MPNLTRGTTRPSPPQRRLLLVRQPVRSVRRHDQPDRTPLHLALGVIVAVGVIAAVWLLGHLGYRLGFAALVRVPDLVRELGGGLTTGTLVVIAAPRAVFQAGLARPTWLMIGFAMIALPAAGLGAAPPPTPGGPRLKPALSLIASFGAVLSITSGVALVWWTGSAVRGALLRPLPLEAAAAADWHADLLTVAGLDTLAVVTAALWVVLVLRLPIPLWLRSIAASAAFFTLVVATVAMAISSVAAAEAGAARSLAVLPGQDDAPRVIVGSTPRHLALLGTRDGRIVVELRSQPGIIEVRGHTSIVGFLSGE